MEVSNGQSIKIADHGEIKVLSYAGLLDYHNGDSIWGLSVAFRAMQLAAGLYSGKSISHIPLKSIACVMQHAVVSQRY